MIHNILIAPDKFKGSLSGADLCDILKDAIHSEMPNVQIETCPLADGGDGSVEILACHLNLKKVECTTVDPLGRPMESFYYTSANTAYIELASASGLILLDDSDRNPMLTSTFGTGLQIKHAIEYGIENVHLFLGGSATNDGGMGIASALGYIFYDQFDKELKPSGASLNLIRKIEKSEQGFNIKKLVLFCDVENRPYGPQGAAYVYGSQKGASEKEIEHLDLGLRNLCLRIQDFSNLDLSDLKGGGAAGGVAVCSSGLLNAEIRSGFEMISETLNLEYLIENVDMVISGEGRLDSQSFNGKVVSKVADICIKHNKKLWVVVGKNELLPSEIKRIGIDKVFSIMDYTEDTSNAIKNASIYVNDIGVLIASELE